MPRPSATSRLWAPRARHRRPRHHRLLLLTVVAALTAGGAVLATASWHSTAPEPGPAAVHPFHVPPASLPGLLEHAAHDAATLTRGANTPADTPGGTPAPAGQKTAAPASALTVASHVYVPSLGISAPWIPAAFSFATGLAVPADVHTLGLSSQGGQPDQAGGTVLMAGHVNYVGQGPGSLEPIAQIRPGAAIITTDDTGRRSVWAVTSLDAVLKADLPHSLFTPVGPRRLVLVTCGGTLHHGTYDDNIVVTAVPVTAATAGAS